MREKVECSYCGKETISQTWSYKKAERISTFFCNKTCKGMWQKTQRENLGYTKEWLIEEYVVKGKSTYQIGREIKRDSKRIWEWLTDYGIKTRPRGTDHYGYQFKKGEPSAFKGMQHTEENKERARAARLKDGRMPFIVNGVHWLHYYKGRHPASWLGGVSPERQAVYSSREWADAVKHVWHRDNAKCVMCGKNHNEKTQRGTFHIHHIVSFKEKSLRTSHENLVLLCRKCHLWVHSRENKEKLYIKDKI